MVAYRPLRTCGECTWETWSWSIARGFSLSGESRYITAEKTWPHQLLFLQLSECNFLNAIPDFSFFLCSRWFRKLQPVRFSRTRKTAILRVLGGCFWTPGWVRIDLWKNCLCTNQHLTEYVIAFTKSSLLLYIEREQINLKVVQTLGSDKVQVIWTIIFFNLIQPNEWMLPHSDVSPRAPSVRRTSRKVWQEGFQASPSPTAAHEHLCCAGGQDQDQTEDWLRCSPGWKAL